jgi:hypothetical protein
MSTAMRTRHTTSPSRLTSTRVINNAMHIINQCLQRHTKHIDMRRKLIDAIFDMVADEILTIKDAQEYAAMSDEQLVDELISIAKYFRENNN